MRPAVATRATRWLPWAYAGRPNRRSVLHRVIGVTLYWRDGQLSGAYAGTACGRALPRPWFSASLRPALTKMVCTGCVARLTVDTPVPEQRPWRSGDGTMWLYSPELNIWNGWVPGEDGLWEYSPDEFRRWYPEAPNREGTR